MKTIALVVSLALHLGALSVLPGNNGDSAGTAVVAPATVGGIRALLGI